VGEPILRLARTANAGLNLLCSNVRVYFHTLSDTANLPTLDLLFNGTLSHRQDWVDGVRKLKWNRQEANVVRLPVAIHPTIITEITDVRKLPFLSSGPVPSAYCGIIVVDYMRPGIDGTVPADKKKNERRPMVGRSKEHTGWSHSEMCLDINLR